MDNPLDDIDKRIIFRLSQDARETTASEIAEEMNVSPGTIRNRIKQLEERGVIRGYPANVDYELVENRLTNLYICSSSDKNPRNISRKALQIPGVIHVRTMTAGQKDLHITGIGKNTDELVRIGEELTDLGVKIREESLIHEEKFRPYVPFGPKSGEREPVIGFRKISDRAEAVDVAIREDSPVAGKDLKEIKDRGLIPDNLLIVAIERENKTLTPEGSTVLKAGDVVTIFSSSGISKENIKSFE